MSDYPDCFESQNVICKHVRAIILVYVDLNKRLSPGVTITDPVVSTENADIVLGDPEVVAEDVVIEQTSDCGGLTLYAGRAIKFEISSGASSDDEVIVTVGWETSDGQTDFVDCRLLVGGVAA